MTTRAAHVLPRLPKSPRIPYIRPSEPKAPQRRAMTIAAAFQCEEGFVLCADRQMSHGTDKDIGSFSHYEKKVFGEETVSVGAALCGSGNDGSLIRPFATAFFKELGRTTVGEEIDIGQTRPALEETLNDFTAKIGGIPDLSLLIAAVDGRGDYQFLRSDGLIVQPAREVEIMGIGETSLVRYLIDSVYDFEMSLPELTALAAFIVYVAKQYCPQYCGGTTDVWSLPKTFFLDSMAVDETKIKKMEKVFAERGPDNLKDLIIRGAVALNQTSS